MKYYAKLLPVAAFVGFFCIMNCARNGTLHTFSDMILLFGFQNVSYHPYYIVEITYWFIPLLLFQILYGTCIYRHFCCASIYFFSRCCNRIEWFLKEVLLLYLAAVLYLMILVASGFFAALLFGPVKMDGLSWILLGYYLLIHSLFLLITTLLINLLSILFTSNVSFALVEGMNLSGMAAFCLTGTCFIPDEALLPRYTWILKVNPIAHLIFSVHGSSIDSLDRMINEKGISFDLNLSVGIGFAAAFLATAGGCLLVQHYDFLHANREMGGN